MINELTQREQKHLKKGASGICSFGFNKAGCHSNNNTEIMHNLNAHIVYIRKDVGDKYSITEFVYQVVSRWGWHHVFHPSLGCSPTG